MRRRHRPDMPHARCQAVHLHIIDVLDVAPPVATPAETQQPADYDDGPPQDVERLVLEPGDTLVVRVARPMTDHETTKYHQRVRAQLPASVGVVIVNGDEVGLIRPDTRHMVAIDESQPDRLEQLLEPYAVRSEPEWPAPPAGTKWSDFEIRNVPGSSFDTAEPPIHYMTGGLGEPEVACGGRIDSPDGWFADATPHPNLVTCEPCRATFEPRRNVAIRIAREFHETYERLAPQVGYETRAESAVPWDQVPVTNRTLMANVVEDLLTRGVIACGSDACR